MSKWTEAGLWLLMVIASGVLTYGFFALCFLVNKLTQRISGAIVRKLSKKVPE